VQTEFFQIQILIVCIISALPKAESTFDVTLDKPKGVMRIAGNSFSTRPAERVSKKIKSFMEFVGPSVYKSKLKWSSGSDDSFL